MNITKPNSQLLVLPSWYPSEMDPSSGDFIQRHVEAISLFKKEYVLYVVKDEMGLITKSEKSVLTKKENYTEEIIYYHPPKTKFKFLNKFLSHQFYKKVYKKAIKRYFESYGLPQTVHVHVAQKAGLLALWVKRKYKIPFILTEHWTAYLPEADLKISDHSLVFKRGTKKIFSEAKLVTVVSKYLGEAIKSLYPFINYHVIPNVVNEKIIARIPKEDIEADKNIFIHASTQNYQKNTEAILEAFALLKNESGILLQLFGPTNKTIVEKIKDLKIENLVEVKGNVSQEVLFRHIKNAKAVILYSRFETFGCVLIEANALGVPVIVSDLPVFKEVITQAVNGFYAGNNNPAFLANEIKKLFKIVPSMNEASIKETAKKYNYLTVGEQFDKLL